jgi:predicted O-methyltransferase YrrM
MHAFESVEHALASQTPFGDDVSILDGRRDLLIAQLEELTSDMAEAKRLVAAVGDRSDGNHRRLFTETTMRSAIGHAYKQLVLGAAPRPQLLRLTDCAAVFAAAARYLECGGTDTPLQDGSLVALGPEPFYGWIWRDEHPDDPYGRVFRELIRQRYRMLPTTPARDGVDMLARGAELLGELLPMVARSALHHANTIACMPADKAFFGSSSRPDLGGTFFLRETLGSPWWVAEHMLHESTHLKLYDLLGAETLTQADGGRVERPVLTPWNPSMLSGANRWHGWRVLAAFHVYLHLALLASVAERRATELAATYGPLEDIVDSRRALDRCGYLGRQLRAHPQCWEALGVRGQELAGWLQSLLDTLDPDPAPDGAVVHLYLDRYHRETERVEQMLADPASQTRSVRRGLIGLARKDVESTRAILADLDAEGALTTLNAAVAGFVDDELADGYPEIRRTVESCLREAGAQDARVGELVENASDDLYALSARIPEPVIHAKRRAVAERFARACPDEVGRLLAVQAAHLPTGARILEIGAGVGVMTAWLVAGLGSRGDVQIVAIETDETLGATARTYRWPPFVRLETRDAATVLADNEGGFDLVFADAFAWTADDVDAMVGASSPGAMLVLAYNAARPGATGTADTLLEARRRTVLGHDDLVATEIDAPRGLLIATKRML